MLKEGHLKKLKVKPKAVYYLFFTFDFQSVFVVNEKKKLVTKDWL